MIYASDIAKKYISFFKKHGHAEIPNSPLVLQNDPTTLFTSSGMQPLVPYLLGEPHPQGKRLVNVQNCFRAIDIDEVGDNRHTTFFRMLGNWSLGDYFKKEEIPWLWEFLTEELQLPKEKLFITVFNGINDIPKDEEAVSIWKGILTKAGLDPEKRIYYYNDKSNWWSRSGTPDKMPIGEPGGPSSEVFFEFSNYAHNPKYGGKCHPNCDCGRFMEIGNSVIMQYVKQKDGSFKPLPKSNIDFGGGLERVVAAVHNTPDIFQTDLYINIIIAIESVTGKNYTEQIYKPAMRIIADHMKGATYIIIDGVVPGNKEHGYILRRLLRRSAVKMHQLTNGNLSSELFYPVIDAIFRTEEKIGDKINKAKQYKLVKNIVEEEINRFSKTLDKGLKEVAKSLDEIDDRAFDLYQSYGFPLEILEEIVKEKGKSVNREKFQYEFQKHKELSRSASAGKFRGGLADHQERTIMGHTATHLMHKALRDILGNHVHQTGSNITTERVRFDFNYDQKLTDEQIKTIEDTVNKKIQEDLPVHYEMIPTDKAKKIGAIGLFEENYGDVAKIYFIGDTSKSYNDAYSKEFCGGPHVEHTNVLRNFKIIKQENLGKSQKRLYAIVGS
jgi:alanyl-tRNA synthetase